MGLNSKVWLSPAKLNLFLHIIGRRSDGYHLLQTVFQFIDLFDELHFRVLEDDIIKRSSKIDGVLEKEDLVILAARKLKEKTTCRKGVDIYVKKNIPMGAGLGGGSSDAATTLVALNELWQTGLTTDELAKIGLTLGADIPVFVYGHAAWAEGVGEILTRIDLDESYYLVIYPNCLVATAKIFNAHDLTRDTPAITICDFIYEKSKNDCEEVVRKYYTEVAKALDWLGEFAIARLTGTGACVFAKFNNKKSAIDVKNKLPDSWQGFIVRSLNRSPLLERLEYERN